MFLADTHSDTLFSLGVGKRTFAQTDITPDRLRQGGVSLQTLALWSGPKGPNGDYEAVADAEYAAIHHFTDAGIPQVDDPEDVKPGENTFMLSFEGCEVFQKSDEMVAFWRQRGIRIGALITKNKKLRNAVMKFCQARLSPPLIGQIVAEASIDAPRSYSTEVYEEYIERRKCLIDGLNRIPGVYSPIPMGAFYTVARLPVDDSDKFCAWCLSDFEYEGETVMMAPASGFYSDPACGRNEVRIAYVLKKEDLERALLILGKALEAYNAKTKK